MCIRALGIEAAETMRQFAEDDRQVHRGACPQQPFRLARQASLQTVHINLGVEQERWSCRGGNLHEVQIGIVPAWKRQIEPLRFYRAQ